VALERPPKFSREAAGILTQVDGEPGFRERYGDYYVYGYELGAEAGACISAESSTYDSAESRKITVTVKTLFGSASTSHKETFQEHQSSVKLTFSGFSTLHGEVKSYPGTPGPASVADLLALQEGANANMARVARLDHELQERMTSLGLTGGGQLPWHLCGEICRAGLVVQLLLAPFRTLVEYQAIGAKRDARAIAAPVATVDVRTLPLSNKIRRR
jgi:hypothetical protein